MANQDEDYPYKDWDLYFADSDDSEGAAEDLPAVDIDVANWATVSLHSDSEEKNELTYFNSPSPSKYGEDIPDEPPGPVDDGWDEGLAYSDPGSPTYSEPDTEGDFQTDDDEDMADSSWDSDSHVPGFRSPRWDDSDLLSSYGMIGSLFPNQIHVNKQEEEASELIVS